jgi:hypothetical protein
MFFCFSRKGAKAPGLLFINHYSLIFFFLLPTSEESEGGFFSVGISNCGAVLEGSSYPGLRRSSLPGVIQI